MMEGTQFKRKSYKKKQKQKLERSRIMVDHIAGHCGPAKIITNYLTMILNSMANSSLFGY